MSEKPILCFDTSTKTGSVVVADKDKVLASFCKEGASIHTETLFPAIKNLLKNIDIELADIGAIAVARGPGSFTGLRIAASTAKTLAWSLNLPLFAVSSLESLAASAISEELHVCPLFDAQRDELYAALYRGDRNCFPEEVLEPCALDVETLAGQIKELNPASVVFLGEGYHAREAELKSRLGELISRPEAVSDTPDAANLARLIFHAPDKYRVADIGAFEPEYIRTGQVRLGLKKQKN